MFFVDSIIFSKRMVLDSVKVVTCLWTLNSSAGCFRERAFLCGF